MEGAGGLPTLRGTRRKVCSYAVAGRELHQSRMICRRLSQPQFPWATDCLASRQTQPRILKLD